MRIILYTGKGGVGKTTVSAATGLRAAGLGYKTLVLSTDPAHSLSDAFDTALGADPVPVTERLWGQEVNVLEDLNRYWGEVQQYLTALFATRGLDEVIAEEMAVFPGMEELCSLLHVRQHFQEKKFDCLVVDCAPTGETMRLLSFPDAARWYMEKLFPWERRIVTSLGPVIQPLVPVPLPKDDVYAALERLFHRIDGIKEILVNPQYSTIRLVLNPEKMVIKEAQRALTYLNLYGYVTDAVISNRVMPKEATSGYFAAWQKVQQRHRLAIQEAFAPLPIWEVPMFDREVVGLNMLERMAEALFDRKDPTKVQFEGYVQTVRKSGKGYTLKLKLPFVERGDVSLLKRGDDLMVSIGNFRRDLHLPRVLTTLPVTRAWLEGGILTVRFAENEGGDTDGKGKGS